MGRYVLLIAGSALIAGCWCAVPGRNCTSNNDCPGGTCDMTINKCLVSGTGTDAAVGDGGNTGGPDAGVCAGQAPGTRCALCAGCDDAGACAAALDDDPGCQTVACSTLDAGPCQGYSDLTSHRCAGPNQCRTLNRTDCASALGLLPNETVCGTQGACLPDANGFGMPKCDVTGTCQAPEADPAPTLCAPFLCQPTGCPLNCQTGAVCVTGLCDQLSNVCAPSVSSVDCSADAGALQGAIDLCNSADAGTCYLEVVAGSCDHIVVENQSVYIDADPDAGISIYPPTVKAVAVAIAARGPESTRAVLSGISVLGGSGTPGGGVQCVGLDGGSTACTLLGCTIGSFTPPFSNVGDGIYAESATLSVDQSTVQGNVGIGVEALLSNVSLTRTTVLGNTGIGVSLSGGTLSVINDVVAQNSTSKPGFGVLLANPSGTFELNTVADNGLQSATAGIECVGNSIGIHDTIVWNNGDGGTAAGVINCGTDFAGSHVQGTTYQSCGTGAAPQFQSGTYLLVPSSSCTKKVICDPAVTTDIDGDPRPCPGSPCNPAGCCDVGADQVCP